MRKRVNGLGVKLAGLTMSLATLAGTVPGTAAMAQTAASNDVAAASKDLADAGRGAEGETRAYRLSWGVRAIGADKLHKLGVTGKGVTIAVIDSGMGPDAAGLSKSLSDASVDILPNRHYAADGDRHAVYIAETLVGSPDGSGAVGVAYGATVMSVRADSDGACKKECAFTARNLTKAVDYAVSRHARIIDLSLAGAYRLGGGFEQAMARAVKAGAVVIIAAGNEGKAEPEWPGRYAADPRFSGSVVAVGAVNKQGELADFSDRAGATRAAYITAPGQKVVTDCDAATCAIISGTSFAAPHVAGALALIMQAFPQLSGPQALDVLLRGADGEANAEGDTVYGRGRLDVWKAYKLGQAEQGTVLREY